MHNYLKKLEKLLANRSKEDKMGNYALLDVRHDDWCAVYKGGECNCDPDVSLVPDVDKETFVTAMTKTPRAD